MKSGRIAVRGGHLFGPSPSANLAGIEENLRQTEGSRLIPTPGGLLDVGNGSRRLNPRT
jgi:hypothetical protein